MQWHGIQIKDRSHGNTGKKRKRKNEGNTTMTRAQKIIQQLDATSEDAATAQRSKADYDARQKLAHGNDRMDKKGREYLAAYKEKQKAKDSRGWREKAAELASRR